MIKGWTWIEWGWFFGSIEAFVATSLLMLATLVLSWRFPGKLLPVAAAGFFVAFVGNVFRFFVLLRSESLCGPPSVSDMPEYIDCTHNLAGLGTAISAAGLLLAGACLLAFAIRMAPRKSSHVADKSAAI